LNCKRIISICTEENLKLVFVSKSLTHDSELSTLFKSGGHTIHMSLGMQTKAQSEELRYDIYKKYKEDGVFSKLRIIADVTEQCEYNIHESEVDDVLVTPMRHSSKQSLENYKYNPDNYEFISGFYRPKFIHPSWDKFLSWCGEVGCHIYCSQCLTQTWSNYE